jgi:hypothetical protein
MLKKTRHMAVVLFAVSALALGSGATIAGQTTVGDGLINVAVGDITITDAVDIGVAAQVAANICGVKVGPVAVLGRAVDKSGTPTTVCTTDQGPVRLVQN